MVTALYRRYRPETFAELIGQSQVTEPLQTALRTNRVNHAYLFSGPRGCGKTTSARILARCLNCVEGPTDAPCGVCPSCVELSRDGGGSLDVVEIDAASHNGVDDARDLRERAVFAPARDRYKVFILDEAHMVTPQGFNALLKIVEEPPEHVKFIFATTEPDKVIGTIRSRTHHYPFRLVPPAQLLEYLQQLAGSEGVEVEPGVLPLVVRAGGGSVRDTLSILDQLIAGSEGAVVSYERAVALLGYTHGALLAEVVEAIGARDAAAVFAAVDRVIQTGQDPRRFVEDLLEHLRDMIIVAATTTDASAVLRGIQQEELDRMAQQAALFGPAELSRTADVVNAALSEMTGATSPRLHLELMMARILVPAGDARGALARVERLERRVGVAGDLPAAAPGTSPAAAPLPAGPVTSSRAEKSGDAGHSVAPVTIQQVKDAWPEILEAVQKIRRSAWAVAFTVTPLALDDLVLLLSFPSENDVADFREQQASGDSVSEILRRAIVEVLGVRVMFKASIEAGRRQTPPTGLPSTAAWGTEPEPPADEDRPGDAGESPVESPAESRAEGPAESSAEGPATAPSAEPDAETATEAPPATSSPAKKKGPAKQPEAKQPPAENTPAKDTSAKDAPEAPAEKQRYGESVVREILGASFIGEHPIESAPGNG